MALLKARSLIRSTKIQSLGRGDNLNIQQARRSNVQLVLRWTNSRRTRLVESETKPFFDGNNELDKISAAVFLRLALQPLRVAFTLEISYASNTELHVSSSNRLKNVLNVTIALVVVILKHHCNEEVNSICILFVVPEHLLVSSATCDFCDFYILSICHLRMFEKGETAT